MKKIIIEFFGHFFSNPLLPLLVIIGSVFVFSFTGDENSEMIRPDLPDYVRTTVYSTSTASSMSTSSAGPTSAATTSSVTLTALSSATTTSAAAETTASVTADSTTAAETQASSEPAETTEAAEEPRERPQVSDYNVYVGADSPNSAYYQERLTILGDSIASGFNAYGYIPYEHNIARESMALWNMKNYTFDLGGGQMSAVDAAVHIDASLIYLSIGMNDIPGTSPDSYAQSMYSLAQQLVDSIPDTTVVIGSITPVSADNYYTTNTTIDAFNHALSAIVSAYGSPQILYFDANSVLKDPNTGCLASNVSGGDGLHISGTAYGYLLNALFNYLDGTDTMSRIEQHDSKYE